MAGLDALIDHQAELQQQVDRLSTEVLSLAVAVGALALAVIVLAVMAARQEGTE